MGNKIIRITDKDNDMRMESRITQQNYFAAILIPLK